MLDNLTATKPPESSGREAPRLIWWLQGEERQNFGDFLTEFLWNHLADRIRVPGDGYRLIGSAIADGIVHADLHGLGNWEHGRIVFWCCGMRDEQPLSPESVARSVFCGVRGPLTRDVLNLPPSTPLGDPALLLPIMYDPRPNARTKGKAVCSPHFRDATCDERLLESTGAEVIVRPSIANSPEALTQIVDELASADFVLAGSLHAAIVASAYDVPFCYFDNGNVDLPFKWRDFSASVNIGTFFVDNIAEGKRIYETAIRPRLRKLLLFPILAAAPFRARPQPLLKAALHDAERLGARDPIDLEAFSRFVDLAESDIAAVGSEFHRRAIVESEQRLGKESLARADALQELARANGTISALTEALAVAEKRIAERAQERDAARAALAIAEAQAVERAQERDATRTAFAVAQMRGAERARERDAARAAQADAVREQGDAVAALDLQQAQLSRLDEERGFLARELTKAYSRPWRPIKYLLSYCSLIALEFVTAPYSERVSSRFKRSAEKRRPRRFERAPLPEVSPNIPVRPPEPELSHEHHRIIQTTPIEFPPVSSPEVSIIIPAYKGLDDVEACLRSLSDCKSGEPSFEVILVDDCPSEPVLSAIPDSEGLIKVANRQNLGFLLTCNTGAAKARGRYLCFLNSDTIVGPGWLRALVEAAEETPRAAIVGPMLLNVDGTIQDAGWRILSNGWGRPIGREGNPRDGAYTYRRAVDCVTGACFLVPAKTFKELGGLDPVYAPAFYEEFDFAFRARAAGLRTIYEPRSRVTHRGSASYGAEKRDELSGVNHAKFVSRFAETLRKQPHDTDDEFVLRNALEKGPVILVVDDGMPRPDRHAGGVTMSGYLGLLASAGWRVVFGPMDGDADGPAAEALERQGVELIRAPSTIEGWLSEHGKHVREAWLARPEVAALYFGAVRAHSKANVTYYTHDLHHVRMRQEAELRNDPALRSQAENTRLIELGVLHAVDRISSPSEVECEEIGRLAPGKPAYVLPPFFYESGDLHLRSADHFASRSDIVFVGGFPHTPNVDAALFIAQEIMPLVWREIEDVRLVLVGYAPPKEVQSLAGPRTVVTGQVPEIEPYMDQARVNLAALRFGAGVKGKVVQALQLGVPVVTTSIGAEGVGIEPGRDAIVAEGAEALAQAVVSLLRDAPRCAELSAAGVELVRRRFSRASARSAIERIFTTTRCGVCGSAKVITSPPTGNFREAFVCNNCYAPSRTEALARVLVSHIAKNCERSLAELTRSGSDSSIHEFGFVGGIPDTLRGWKNYSMSEYFDDVPVGTPGPQGVRCEDLTRLTYPDESFDVVISQDVIEHVPDPTRAFAEISRVLRPGGSHFFTAPQNPSLEKSVTRAHLDPNGVEYLLPPEFRGDAIRAQGALVFTDFGSDLAAMQEGVGLSLIEHTLPVLGGGQDQLVRVFEARKASGGVDRRSVGDLRLAGARQPVA